MQCEARYSIAEVQWHIAKVVFQCFTACYIIVQPPILYFTDLPKFTAVTTSRGETTFAIIAPHQCNTLHWQHTSPGNDSGGRSYDKEW